MRLRVPPIAALLVALAGCGDPNPLPPPNFSNTVDTVGLFAVTGTAVWLPSGYAMTELRRVRLDQTTQADFAFDIRNGVPVFLPGATVGQPGSLGLDPGLKRTTGPFAGITLAEVNGYATMDTVQVKVGDVFFIRSRVPAGCFFGLPTYGKLEVLEIFPDTRGITVQLLVNANCGYRSLEPGLPTR